MRPSSAATHTETSYLNFSGYNIRVGIPEIDREHEALFELSREFERAVIVERPLGEVRALLSAVIAGTKTHFENEERILAPFHLKREDKHKAEHCRLLKHLDRLFESMRDPPPNWRHNLIDISDILFRHIITFDMECTNRPSS